MSRDLGSKGNPRFRRSKSESSPGGGLGWVITGW